MKQFISFKRSFGSAHLRKTRQSRKVDAAKARLRAPATLLRSKAIAESQVEERSVRLSGKLAVAILRVARTSSRACRGGWLGTQPDMEGETQ